VKQAVAYKRGNKFIVASSSTTTAGVWLQEGPYATLATNASAETIGEAIISALGRSRAGIPHPTDWKRITEPLLAAAGVKTYSTFAKAAQMVLVQLEDDRILLLPMNYGGSKEGFVANEEHEQTVRSSASAKELADALLRSVGD
jgi:hypothetical protein